MSTMIEQSPQISRLPGHLSTRTIQFVLILLPTFYFLLIFWPAIWGGKMYGNRPNQEKLATELNSYSVSPNSSLLARMPEMLHPDYELLYQPTNKEIQKAFRNGRLPLYNPHRLLGTVLWGSPVADAANPLSVFLLFFSPERVHLLKIYVYILLAFIGVYLCATLISNAAPIPALIGASVYVLNPFMYYMYHWVGLLGVVSLVPLLFCLTHLCLVRPRFLFLALVQILFAWMLLINQVQVLLYFFVFLALWIIVALGLKVYSLPMLLRRLPVLVLSTLGGIALSLGYTRYLFEAGIGLARQPHSYQAFSEFWPALVQLRLLLFMWVNAMPLDFWHYDSALVFFPVVVLAVIVVTAFGVRKLLTRTHAALAVILWVLVIHCFVRPLHYPLYLVHLPLYNLNWEHWRVVYLFYFTLSLVTAFSITLLSGAEKVERWRFFAIAFTVGAGLYAYVSVITLTAHADRVVLPLTAMLGLLILSHAFFRHFSQRHVIALGACVVAACLYLPMTRVPFYRAEGNRNSASPSATVADLTRSMRLIALDQISQPKGEYLWFNDSVMAMFSRNGATGYDTALQQREANLFSSFYSPNLRYLRSVNPFLKYGVQSSIVWPEADGILTGSETLGGVNEARLRLLGVGSLLWNRRIGNLAEPRWNSVLQSWEHLLPSSSPINLLPDTSAADIARLFSGSADVALADRVLSKHQPAALRFDEKSGSYRAELPAESGLVLIAYNFGRFYKPFLDGAPALAEATELPFLLVWKRNPAPAVLDLRPQTTGIWITTLAGLSLGLLITAAVKWHCAKSVRCPKA